MKEAVVVTAKEAQHAREIYCHDCKQLRLWLKPEAPTACGNCKSENVEVDVVNSPRLTKLRYPNGQQ